MPELSGIQWLLIVAGIVIGWKAIAWIADNTRKAQLYEQLKPRLHELDEREARFEQEQAEWAQKVQQDKAAVEVLAKQKSQGFPWLAQAYADYFHLQDLETASYLETKSHPAKRAAEITREIASQRREAERRWRVAKYQLEYYQTLFPWLVEFQEEYLDDVIRQLPGGDSDTGVEANEDPARHWLTQEEYMSLSTAEKYQLALDRYWQKSKSRWKLGRDYERFIGYRYETRGWQVRYQGIVEGFADLGRDLVITRGGRVGIIQCKYWARHKVIHEKHVFQLYGTMTAYRIDNPDATVTGLFVTSTVLSDRAKQFAQVLGVKYIEQFPLERYPCVKCNVSRKTGERIYHLPFDQQYDKTIIEKERHERYVETVKEAEALGFRRAYRWRGNSDRKS
jgi:hypothetical protein